jgi:hypothetical protein
MGRCLGTFAALHISVLPPPPVIMKIKVVPLTTSPLLKIKLCVSFQPKWDELRRKRTVYFEALEEAKTI